MEFSYELSSMDLAALDEKEEELIRKSEQKIDLHEILKR